MAEPPRARGRGRRGPGWRSWIAPEPLDAERGTYLAVVDTDDDVSAQGWCGNVASEDDTEGQGSPFVRPPVD